MYFYCFIVILLFSAILFCVILFFCSYFYCFICSSVGLLPPGENPIAVVVVVAVVVVIIIIIIILFYGVENYAYTER